tara:strand:- start:283 stop:789 length:507 start_codon:yes stop_codon:yes gene_type:complete
MLIVFEFQNNNICYSIMGFFEKLFPDIDLDSEEEDYDPYDTTGKYGQYGTCKRGFNFSSTQWCCMECERDRMAYRRAEKQWKEHIFANLAGNIFDDDDSPNFTFQDDEPILQITNDWKFFDLIPPKTKDEIKKKYRKLCLKYHPDKGGDSEKFIQLQNSYNNLLCIVC